MPVWQDTAGVVERARVGATAAAVNATVGRLRFLRGLDAYNLDLSMLPAERRRLLAAVGRRSTNQALERRHTQRRYIRSCWLGLASRLSTCWTS
jgi:hypothetical protein